MNRSVFRYYILLLLVFSWTNGQCQIKTEIDSLKKELIITNEDSTKIDLLLQLGTKSFRKKYDYTNAFLYAEKALQLSHQLKYKKREAISYNLLGDIYRQKLDFSKAIKNHLLALKIMENINDTSGIGDCYFYIADVFKVMNGYERSFTYFNMALRKFQVAKDTLKMGKSLEKLGHISMDKTVELSDNDAMLFIKQALKYYHQASVLYQKQNDQKNIANCYVNIANAYLGLGRIDKKNSQAILEKSIFYSNLSLTVSRKAKGSELESLNLINIGEAYEIMNEDQKAIQYYTEGQEKAELKNELYWTIISFHFLGRVYLKQKDYVKSEFYLEKSLKRATEISASIDALNNYKLLSEVYSATKKFEKAYLIEQKITALKDSIQIEATKRATTLIQMEFESERKDKEINLLNKNQELQNAKLKQQDTISNYLTASVVLASLLLLVIHSRFIVKAKATKIIEEKNKQLEKLSIVAHETASGVFITDANGDLEWFNEGFSKLFGWDSIEEYIKERGKNIFEVSGNNDIDNLIKEAIHQKKSITYENPTPSKNQEALWIQTTLTPIFDQKEKLSKLVFVETDITGLKNSQEQLVAANKELEAFSYSVSHDLRAPLRAINGYSKILHEDYAHDIDTDGLNAINAILNNSKRMGELIDDLLTFSRLGRTEMTLSDINMSSLVQSIIEEEELHRNSNQIKFILKELLPSNGSHTLIKQVWINLISNAIKFSKNNQKSVIEIGSYSKDSSIIYYVKDNGAGFDMNYYDKLFGVFQRLHSQEEFEGTGIGLAIVHKIIYRHNGLVWAESKLNKGTCFYFSLPINKT